MSTAPAIRRPSAAVRTASACLLAACAAAAGGVRGAAAQSAAPPGPRWVMPQAPRAFGSPAIVVTDVSAAVELSGAAATVTLEVGIRNTAGRAEEAVLLVPVPAQATVTGFAFQGPASEPTARFVPRDEARALYDQIVARERDPALLEWAGWNLLRSSVFPVPAGGTQRVRISWESLLERSGDRVDFVLPRSDLAGGPPWRIEVLARGADVSAAYSPSHDIVTRRDAAGLRITANPSGAGAFRLSVVRSSSPVASVISYPDPVDGGGWFLLLAAAPAGAEAPSLRREVTLVLDRSGSMAGQPFERARAAALRILDGLSDGDSANVIDFSNGVTRFADAPVTLSAQSRARLREHVNSLRPGGGTNIHDALLEALRQPAPPPGTLATVLFVTDGVPTIGRTREADIRALAERANPGGRRIFTVGLGNDVNVPLLDRLADVTRAEACYLAMNDDLATRLAEVAERLCGPVLAETSLEVKSAGGAPAPGRVEELLPLRLPDLFRGGTLVVLGRYRGNEPFRLQVRGRGAAGEARISVDVDPAAASTANAFVPRLWASRRIAVLIDELRQQGLDQAGVPASDPRRRELVGEIVRLSTTWGILTEYTSMLALEGSNLHDWRALESACLDAVNGRAVQTRVGAAAVNQGVNWNRQKLEQAQSATTCYVAPGGAVQNAQAMNQCADKTFYRTSTGWADAALAGRELRIDEETAFGSTRHQQLVWELAAEGRQSALAMDGDIVLRHHGRTILVRAPHAAH